jgi:2'-5' RNA ligase
VSSEARRLFYALWPDDPVRHALLHWQTANLPATVRWQHRADLHLTLHFLGQVEPDRLDALRALGAGIRVDGFELVLDRLGHWPRPQVLWAGPAEIPRELAELHARLGAGLQALGFELDRRPFAAHLTLARKIRHRPPGATALEPVTWQVREFALVESVPGSVPAYRLLARWPLAEPVSGGGKQRENELHSP